MGHAFAVVIEMIRRSFARLDPRLYFERLRIKRVVEGLLTNASGRYAVLVVYAQACPPMFTLNLIAALERAGYNIVLVSNGRLDHAATAELLNRCSLLVERANLGRDFGGYKDGIAITLRRFNNVKRLLLANDSVFYLDDGLDAVIGDLSGAGDFVGVAEAFEHAYHVASFLLSFGEPVLQDAAFRRFWKDYLPISTRMWTVIQGECALSNRLREAGHDPHILFTAGRLLDALRNANADEVRALLPASMRKGVSDDRFAESVTDYISTRNQMHAAGFLFTKFLKLPLIKRDIVYRELFSLADVERIAASQKVPMQTQILADFANRPAPLGGVTRLLYEHGYL